MGLSGWLIKRGAYGLSLSLLLLYRDAVRAGIMGEKERWQFAYKSRGSLPIPLTSEDLIAFKEILDYESCWEVHENSNPIQPAVIVYCIVMKKARNAVGLFIHPDHVKTLQEGIDKGKDRFRKKWPDIKI